MITAITKNDLTKLVTEAEHNVLWKGSEKLYQWLYRRVISA